VALGAPTGYRQPPPQRPPAPTRPVGAMGQGARSLRRTIQSDTEFERDAALVGASGPLIPSSRTASMASSIWTLGLSFDPRRGLLCELPRSALEPTPSSRLQRVQDATRRRTSAPILRQAGAWVRGGDYVQIALKGCIRSDGRYGLIARISTSRLQPEGCNESFAVTPRTTAPMASWIWLAQALASACATSHCHRPPIWGVPSRTDVDSLSGHSFDKRRSIRLCAHDVTWPS
jgi:hypothetical protein